MKKSTLKEVIKSEIKSLLSEGLMTTDEAFRVLRNIQNNYLSDQQKDVMGLALDALQAAEVSRMMDREPSFKGTGERAGFDMRGIDESLNPEVSKSLDSFIMSMAKRYGYEEQDAVYAIMAALEQRKSDTKYEIPGFKGTRDTLDTISIREEEMDDVAMDKAAAKSAKKGDSITATSNKLQKLVKQMKSKAKEFKAAEGDAKEKIKDELKKMTKEKKTLEKAL